MEMMTVEMGLMSHPPAHQDTAHQVTPHQEMISAEADFPHVPFYVNCLNEHLKGIISFIFDSSSCPVTHF